MYIEGPFDNVEISSILEALREHVERQSLEFEFRYWQLEEGRSKRYLLTGSCDFPVGKKTAKDLPGDWFLGHNNRYGMRNFV